MNIYQRIWRTFFPAPKPETLPFFGTRPQIPSVWKTPRPLPPPKPKPIRYAVCLNCNTKRRCEELGKKYINVNEDDGWRWSYVVLILRCLKCHYKVDVRRNPKRLMTVEEYFEKERLRKIADKQREEERERRRIKEEKERQEREERQRREREERRRRDENSYSSRRSSSSSRSSFGSFGGGRSGGGGSSGRIRP